MSAFTFIVAPDKTLEGRFRGLSGGTRLPIGDESSEVAGIFTIGMGDARAFADHGLGSIVGADGLVRAPSGAF